MSIVRSRPLPKNAVELIRAKSSRNPNGCWIWNGARNPYGTVMVRGVRYAAHRLSYETFVGPIGDSNVCHRCDTPSCVNPKHLFLGTHHQNMTDMVEKDRSGARELSNRIGKLTDEQVREIRKKAARGIPTSWLANEYGVGAPWIRSIVSRRVQRGYAARHHAG